MVNFWRDEDPRSALNPSNGMLEVPVTNYTGKEEGEGEKEGEGEEKEKQRERECDTWHAR